MNGNKEYDAGEEYLQIRETIDQLYVQNNQRLSEIAQKKKELSDLVQDRCRDAIRKELGYKAQCIVHNLGDGVSFKNDNFSFQYRMENPNTGIAKSFVEVIYNGEVVHSSSYDPSWSEATITAYAPGEWEVQFEQLYLKSGKVHNKLFYESETEKLRKELSDSESKFKEEEADLKKRFGL